jgi:hypothetical protein
VIALVALVPHPPLLVPELVGCAVAETAQLRGACESAAGRLAAGASRWIAIAADEAGPARVPPSATGTFAGYGVDVPVTLAPDRRPNAGCPRAPATVLAPTLAPTLAPAFAPTVAPTLAPRFVPPRMPLPMLVAGWLRGRVGGRATVAGELLAPSTPAADCAARGRELVDGLSEPVGLLVLGDGASRHAAPGAGRVDERAAPFDEAVRHALAAADIATLLGMDQRLAEELGVTGRPAWQVLAGAVDRTAARWRAELLYSAAPYGVGYHVAVWRPNP